MRRVEPKLRTAAVSRCIDNLSSQVEREGIPPSVTSVDCAERTSLAAGPSVKHGLPCVTERRPLESRPTQEQSICTSSPEAETELGARLAAAATVSRVPRRGRVRIGRLAACFRRSSRSNRQLCGLAVDRHTGDKRDPFRLGPRLHVRYSWRRGATAPYRPDDGHNWVAQQRPLRRARPHHLGPPSAAADRLRPSHLHDWNSPEVAYLSGVRTKAVTIAVTRGRL